MKSLRTLFIFGNITEVLSEMVKRAVARALFAGVILGVFPAHATDTIATNTTVGNTVSSSSNTVSSSSNTVSTSSNTVSTNTTGTNSTNSTVIDKATTAATASSPSVIVNNSDVCVTGVSGAVQTSLFGVSGGGTVRDKNCEILKLSRTLYGAGLKVAAVSLLCQDARVFDAMMSAGTPCPFDGKIGTQAKESWVANPSEAPEGTRLRRDAIKKAEVAEESVKEPADDFDEYPQ
jgi:hypothetical protein